MGFVRDVFAWEDLRRYRDTTAQRDIACSLGGSLQGLVMGYGIMRLCIRVDITSRSEPSYHRFREFCVKVVGVRKYLPVVIFLRLGRQTTLSLVHKYSSSFPFLVFNFLILKSLSFIVFQVPNPIFAFRSEIFICFVPCFPNSSLFKFFSGL